MAESASSVASFVFCGVFAISVVASSLRRTVAAARTVAIGRERHATSQTPSRPPRCKHPRSIARQSSYRLGNAKETTAVKDFFIIVNRLRTIANAVHRPPANLIGLPDWGRRAAKRVMRIQSTALRLHRLNHRRYWPVIPHIQPPSVYLDLVPIRPISPSTIKALGGRNGASRGQAIRKRAGRAGG